MAFQQGLSGLNAAARNLDSIGNNVANANTVGYKQSRTEFADVYATSVFTGGSGSAGIGVRVWDVAQQFTQGDITTSNNSLDMAINGQGFFRMSNNGTVTYSRNGQFHVDKDGYIVNPDGLQLTGYSLDEKGNINSGVPGGLKLDNSDVAPKATTRAGLIVNLDARTPVPMPAFDAQDSTSYAGATSVAVYDSFGGEHAVSLYFRRTSNADNAGGEWEVYGQSDGAPMNAGQPITTLKFGNDGKLAPTAPVTVGVPVTGGAATEQPVTLDLSKMSQYGSAFGVNEITQDGYTTGRLSGFSVSSTGDLLARFTNGQSIPRGRVALANFMNPQGLQAIGGNQWVETGDSGRPIVSSPATGSLGTLQSGALEASNVDLTAELVNMITAQRAYQANAQTIKTEDSLLQTIVNLR